ncbi:MAG: chorismate synthase [archaeon]|nr:chorismate synthase [archaeon]
MYSLGEKFKFSLFGKSHAPCIGCILDGVPKGTVIDEEHIAREMALRKPSQGIGTTRVEKDQVQIVCGVTDGKADGNPITMVIANKDVDDSKYLAFKETPRPGHADLPALLTLPKFDVCGGGQFSGRLTAAIVAGGSVAKDLLSEKGIEIAAFSRSIGHVKDTAPRNFNDAYMSRNFPTRACNGELDTCMTEEITEAHEEGDSIGGVVECIIRGLPIGFGGIWFESLDAEIARAMFGIPACKGVEFGAGFDITRMKGSESNDPYRMDGDRITTATNNLGGIVGGMADGNDVVFKVAFKPTPSIAKKQKTVNILTKEDAELEIKGRHDPCITPRAVAVVEAVAALVLMDQIERGYNPLER